MNLNLVPLMRLQLYYATYTTIKFTILILCIKFVEGSCLGFGGCRGGSRLNACIFHTLETTLEDKALSTANHQILRRIGISTQSHVQNLQFKYAALLALIRFRVPFGCHLWKVLRFDLVL